MTDHRALVDDAGPLLTEVVAAAGGDLRRWRPRQVTHRPGRSTTALHDATVSWRGGAAVAEQLVMHAGRRLPAGTAPVAVADDGAVVTAWRVPFDPALPGLAAALDPARLAELLAELGTAPSDPVTARLRAYRPLRRAVVEVTAPGVRLFCKIVPPAEAEPMHARHRLLAGSVPVPRAAGWSPAGVVVLEAVPGRTLREALSMTAAPIPPFAAVLDVLDRLPVEVADLPGAASPHRRAVDHARLLADVLPLEQGRLEDLAGCIAACDADDAGPVTATHGDLYEAQLVVDGGRIVGLLDVDGAGAGHRIDDVANLLGHLSVLDQASGGRGRAGAVGRAYISAADALGALDPAALRRRVAAVVLGLATGPFRVQQAGWETHTAKRLDLAAAWLRSAARADERDLTPVPT